jgi:ubiquinone/menaquinone biosynthesis C-methylase UbiE
MSGETRQPSLDDVRRFWERNPVAARSVPYPIGTPDYFTYYDALREVNESKAFSSRLHAYADFPGKSVLDIGSGNGYVLSRYAAAGARVYGVDLTVTAIGLCRRRFEWMQLPGHFTVGNAERLPFADRQFDCVCSMGVLHHTPDTEGAVAEVFRVLKPGGRVVLMFYHRDSLQNRLKFPVMRWLKGKSIQQSINEVDGVGNPKGDVYSRTELGAMLRAFTDVKLFAGVLPWHMAGPIGRLVPSAIRTPLERRWGWFLYATGRRP